MAQELEQPLASALAKLRQPGPTNLTPEEAKAMRMSAVQQENIAKRFGLNRRTRRRLGLG